MRLAFIGFRHGHIMQLYDAAAGRAGIQIVAACEEDGAAAESLRQAGKIKLTHTDHRRLLNEVPCDAVAIGDTFGRRGPLAIEALEAGRHIIVDKPLCTRLEQLDRIEALARTKGLSVGCLLDLRSSGSLGAARRLIAQGAIGEVHTVSFTAQHPLLYGKRPDWYFQPGQHGGTINDIAIHATDAIPWITGRRIVAVTAARAWNARLPQHPDFQDAAQFMLRLDNGGGVLGDVSYFAPDGCGYSVPQYWRMTFHGSGGVIEARLGNHPLPLARSEDRQPQQIPPDPDIPATAIESFLAETAGQKSPLTTEAVITASRLALNIQKAADTRADEFAL